jgi:hypothetical protein
VAADGMVAIGSASYAFGQQQGGGSNGGADEPEWNWGVDSAGGVIGSLIEPGLGTLACGLSASFGWWLGSFGWLTVVPSGGGGGAGGGGGGSAGGEGGGGGGGAGPGTTSTVGSTAADQSVTNPIFPIPGGCLCVTEPCPCGGDPNVGTFHNEMLTDVAGEIGMNLAYPQITADVYQSLLAASIQYAQVRLGMSADDATALFAGVDADLHNLGAFNDDGSLRPWSEYRDGVADYALAQGRITQQLHDAMVKMVSYGDDAQGAYAYLTGPFAQTTWASPSDAFGAAGAVEIGVASASLWFGLAASLQNTDPGQAKELPGWFEADVFGGECGLEGGPAGVFLVGSFFSMIAAGNV